MPTDTTGETPAASRKTPWSGQTTWHVARWGPLGWAETLIKLLAILIAVITALDDGAWSIPAAHRVTFWALAFVTAGYVGAALDRWVDREIVSMVFVPAMILGHAAMIHAMGRAVWPVGPVRTFVGLMLLGDLVKIAYFVRSGARVRALPRWVPIGMTSALASIYLVALFGT